MAVLYLSVGGAAYVSADAENGLLTELDFPRHKAHALFVYLGLTQGRRHIRRALGALFWPDADDKGAANNLRQTIHRIRTLLFEASIDPAVIDTSAQQVVLTPSTTVVIDALRIDQVWRECQLHMHSSRQILQALAMFHVASGEIVTALHYVRQWLALEPWEEKAHALAMQLLAARGMCTAASHQFQQCASPNHLGVFNIS